MMRALTSRQYVYQIRNVHTNQRYVGSSEVSPWYRWQDIISKARLGQANARMQAAWDAHPSTEHWEFTVLKEISPKISTRQLIRTEAGFIASVDDSLRLNMPTATTVTIDKHKRVIEMLDAGARYIDIRDEVGISLGMISRIKNRFTKNGIQ